jgi:hypothetical protein
MFKKMAILTVAALMAGLLVVPLVIAECYVPGCTHPDCPVCPIPDCPDCAAHQYQCQSGQTKHVQNARMKMGRYKNQYQVSKAVKWVRIYLYQKDPSNWDIVGDGAWGFLDYRPEGTEFKFLFVGKKLEPFEYYTLIYYPDPWPGAGLMCLNEEPKQADEYGKVKIVGKGSISNLDYTPPVDTGDLPASYDTNPGAKIWLVLSSDVDCAGQQMIGWNPEEYLFENTLITFVDTDD